MRSTPSRLTAAALTGGLAAPVLALVPATATTVPDAATADVTAPVATATFTRQGVVLSATDEGSGVDRIEYRGATPGLAPEAGWLTYTGPFQPWAHDVGGRHEYRAVDRAGNVSAVQVAPKEQFASFRWTSTSPGYGTSSVVKVRATVPTVVTEKVAITAKVRIGNKKKQYTAKVVDGVARVKLPAKLKAGKHRLAVDLAVDHRWVLSRAKSGKVKVVKGITATSATVIGDRVLVGVGAQGSAKPSGKVKAVFTRDGRTVATARAKVKASGSAVVKLPKKVTGTPGTYRVKVRYAGNANLKKSTSEQETIRIRARRTAPSLPSRFTGPRSTPRTKPGTGTRPGTRTGSGWSR